MSLRSQTSSYFAVIFSSQLTDHGDADHLDYAQTAERMVALAKDQPGFLGADSARGDNGFGITVSYWENEDAIAAWKGQTDHLAAQDAGINRFYDHYTVRVAKIDRTYNGPAGRSVDN